MTVSECGFSGEGTYENVLELGNGDDCKTL